VTPRIAMVGMACCYPDAATPAELWENVLAQRRSFRRLPPQRLRAEDYVSANPMATDLTYVARAALIEGWEFDRERYRVVGSTYRQTDLSHWLALDVAAQALEDAGFAEAEGLPRESTGVLVGNTLTGEFSRAGVMRLRWPYVRRVVSARLAKEGWDQTKRAAFLRDLEAHYKHPFPTLGDETLAGGLSNTIAGRICNYFDLGGGGYTIDGACSSSLLSLANACSALVAGDLKVALVGGVDLSLDPFELVGFARLGALAQGEMRVYDANPTGFLPGEGCGFVVLMPLEAALEQKRHIYAVIRGWGISSDGSGGLTRPEIPGQMLSLRRAYQRAGYGSDTIAYFEGHGTGTGIGDEVELAAVSQSIREGTPPDVPAVIGSIKANFGHTKAAAGLAGLLKATLAVHKLTIPPNTGVKNPHPMLCDGRPVLRIARTAERWDQDRPMRAGVSSMGFGGINVHVTVEGYQPPSPTTFSLRERSLLRTSQDAELLLLGGHTREELAQQVGRLLNIAAGLSTAELAELAARLAATVSGREVRAAVVASQPDDLVAALKKLAAWLEEDVDTQFDEESGLFFGSVAGPPHICYLFSGQAAPANLDGGAIRQRFEFVDELYRLADLPQDSDGIATAVAQPAIATASMAMLRLLTRAGIVATSAVGHSLGELTALHWASVYDEATYLRIAAARGRAMTEHCHEAGAMASIGADRATTEKLLKGTDVVIAGLNAPGRTVVSGPEASVLEFIARMDAAGIRAVRLPVSHAFHSPLLHESERVLGEFLATIEFAKLNGAVVSTIVGRPLREDDDLKAILCRHQKSPVLFADALRQAAAAADLMIELGPGEILTALAASQVSLPVIGTDAAGRSLRGPLNAFAAAYALGAELDASVLFSDRVLRPFDLDRRPRFFVNPCELAPYDDDDMPAEGDLSVPSELVGIHDVPPSEFGLPSAGEPVDALTLVRQLVAAKTELPLSAISGESRLLDDLHLNSITVSRIVVEAARRLQLPPLTAPNQFADATVAEVAEALTRMKESGANGTAVTTAQAPGIDSWVRCFTVELKEQPLPPEQPPPEKGQWMLFSENDHILAAALKEELEAWGGRGVIVCLPPAVTEDHIELMLTAARAAVSAEDGSYLLFVQHRGEGPGGARGAASLARTIHLEGRDLTTCVVDVPYDSNSLPRIIQEVKATVGYSEAVYDSHGARRVPRICLLPNATCEDEAPLTLTSDDVLLVTGGGKGIGAECAFALAKQHGLRLALIGRSLPSENDELAANLRRFRDAGVKFTYVAADVTDAQAVAAAVRQVRDELGEVTAFLHSAGTNVPQLIRGLKESAVRHTLAPKVQGAENILAALDRDRLRLVLAFGSIIARAGLRGEADYALANEWLERLVARFGREHPDCRCLCVEWSVWSGVGMGERLGRVQELARDGITAITPEGGLAAIDALLRRRLSTTSVVVTGRFGRPVTLELEGAPLPLLRFLEKTQVHYPGIELVADAELTLDSDPYLKDHVFQGQRLLPAVMGMEAMAQAAMALAEKNTQPVLEQVRFDRPVALPESGRLTIRVAALMREPGLVEVVLRSEESSFAVDHFRAICRFDEPWPAATRLDFEQPRRLEPVAMEPKSELYGGLLFHQGRFQRLGCYRQLGATGCLAEIAADYRRQWFGRYQAADLVLGDPALADTAIHAIQVCVPDVSLLPVGVERVQLSGDAGDGPWLTKAEEQAHDGDLFTYDVEVIDETGRIVQLWRGLQLRTIAGTEHSGEWVPPLLGPYLERKLAEFAPRAEVRVAVENGAEETRAQRRDRAVHRVAGADATFAQRPDGKPELSNGFNLSVAHTESFTLAVSARTPVGCDAQAVQEREPNRWRELLGESRYALAVAVVGETGEEVAIAAARVWTITECLAKLGAHADAPVTLLPGGKDGWVYFMSGVYRAASTVEAVVGATEPLALAVMVRSDDAGV